MGKVVVSFKIFPSDAAVELERVKGRIERELPEYASVFRFDKEPVAFGLEVLIAHIVFAEDEPSGLDKVERSLQKIDEIGQIQTVMVRKLSTL